MSDIHLYIFCRWPEPGKAKTRLIPQFGPDGAAAIYTKLLTHTIEIARASGIPFELRATGANSAAFQAGLGDDLNVVDQGDGDLTDRLSRIPAPAIVIGSDCPGLTQEHLWAAHDTLALEEMVIGPASDGGYYLLGFKSDAHFAFEDIAWSTDKVFEQTVKRFAERGVRPAVLPQLSDVDIPADLEEWPEFLP
ncbi:MAG: glycosyltransferase [Sphingomonadaceae bacterium]|nr:MAG: glycosyltransferase [Sphingomonadaceae bacterium]